MPQQSWDITQAIGDAANGLRDVIDQLDPVFSPDEITSLAAACARFEYYLRRPELLFEVDELTRLERLLRESMITGHSLYYYGSYNDGTTEAIMGSMAPAINLIGNVRHEIQQSIKTELLDDVQQITPALVIDVKNAASIVANRLGSDPRDWYNLGPRGFEEVLAEIWAGLGWETVLTPPSGDGGIDVRAVRSENGILLCYLLEAKAYSPERRVGIDVVRKLYGVVERERATHGILATTSSFTSGAVNEARALRYRVSLADFGKICDWLRDYRARPRR